MCMFTDPLFARSLRRFSVHAHCVHCFVFQHAATMEINSRARTTGTTIETTLPPLLLPSSISVAALLTTAALFAVAVVAAAAAVVAAAAAVVAVAAAVVAVIAVAVAVAVAFAVVAVAFAVVAVVSVLVNAIAVVVFVPAVVVALADWHTHLHSPFMLRSTGLLSSWQRQVPAPEHCVAVVVVAVVVAVVLGLTTAGTDWMGDLHKHK